MDHLGQGGEGWVTKSIVNRRRSKDERATHPGQGGEGWAAKSIVNITAVKG